MMTVLQILSVLTLVGAVVGMMTDKVPTKVVVVLLAIIACLLSFVPLK